MIVRVNVTFPEELLHKLDKCAQDNYMDRSEYLRKLVRSDLEEYSEKDVKEIIRASEEQYKPIIHTRCTAVGWCKAEAIGLYNVRIPDEFGANQGGQKWLCEKHLEQAKKECGDTGEVTEVE